jgi:hypothetical protein
MDTVVLRTRLSADGEEVWVVESWLEEVGRVV